MFPQENRALTRTTSGRSYTFGALKLSSLDTLSGAAEAARDAWWGAAWLAISFALGLLAQLALVAYTGRAQWLDVGIDGIGVLAMTWFAWRLRNRRQPRWIIAIILVLLVLNLIVQLLTLRLGVWLIVNAWLTYLTVHALRGAFRVAALRRSIPTAKDVENIFG